MFRRAVIPLLAFLVMPPSILAQTTRVKGRVLDRQNGRPVSYAAVYFEGSKVGTTAGEDGSFSLATKDLNLTILKAEILGYEGAAQQITPGAANKDVIFFLRPQQKMLDEAFVKPDNSKAKRLLAAIDSARTRNDPECRDGYSCGVYSRIEIDITNPEQQLKGKNLRRQWGFIFDYVDTSEISGKPYLPVLISESVSKRYHTSAPLVDRETVSADRISGINPEGNLLVQFTGGMHFRNNFYSQYMDAFGVKIPSPINSSGLLFYNYYIIDTLDIAGRAAFKVRFHPRKGISTPSFDGQMLVDTLDMALVDVSARLSHGQDVNWVREMAVGASYARNPDGSWFYDRDSLYAEFSISLADSSKLISVIGRRNLAYSDPVFGIPAEADKSENAITVAPLDSLVRDEAYWDKARPYALSQKEKGVFEMVDRIKDTKLFTTVYDVVEMIATGYYDVGKISFGPYLKLVSYNPLEGLRLRVGTRTTASFSRKDRIGGYVAYGFKDSQVKGGVSWEHLFSKDPTRKLTLDAHYDVLQMAKGTNRFISDNIIASVLGGGSSQRLLPVLEGSALYEHEFSGRVNGSFSMRYRRYFPNEYVPFVSTDPSRSISGITSAEACASWRFSRDETLMRGLFTKTYIYSPRPILTLTLAGGACSVHDGSTPAPKPYFRPELALDWKIKVPPVGMTTLHLDGGTVLGDVPYPLLHLHEGNGTFLMDKTAFSTMEFFEFASSSWVTLMAEHNFYGFFLGKIPLIKKLQLREVVLVKATWGCLDEKHCSRVALPYGMHEMGSVPFVEAGVGIANIFRVFRVDCVWRLTHRGDERENPRNFVVNFGVELKF